MEKYKSAETWSGLVYVQTTGQQMKPALLVRIWASQEMVRIDYHKETITITTDFDRFTGALTYDVKVDESAENVFINSVYCTGLEAQLTDCDYDDGNVGKCYAPAAVQCAKRK